MTPGGFLYRRVLYKYVLDGNAKGGIKTMPYGIQWLLLIAWFVFCGWILPRWLTGPNASPREQDQMGGCGLAIFVISLGMIAGWVAERWIGMLSVGAASVMLGILMVACCGL